MRDGSFNLASCRWNKSNEFQVRQTSVLQNWNVRPTNFTATHSENQRKSRIFTSVFTQKTCSKQCNWILIACLSECVKFPSVMQPCFHIHDVLRVWNVYTKRISLICHLLDESRTGDCVIVIFGFGLKATSARFAPEDESRWWIRR